MVTVKLEGFKEMLAMLDEKPVRKAACEALKKVAASATTIVSAGIRERYNVKKSDLDPRIEVKLPQTGDLTAVMIISGKGMSLSYFGARQFVVNRVITRGKGGLKVVTRKRSAQFQGTEIEIIKGRRTQLKSGFMASMKSGHIGILRRDPNGVIKSRQKYAGTKHAEKIVEKRVISIATMYKNSNVQPAVLLKVQEQWGKVFPHELEFQLSKSK